MRAPVCTVGVEPSHHAGFWAGEVRQRNRFEVDSEYLLATLPECPDRAVGRPDTLPTLARMTFAELFGEEGSSKGKNRVPDRNSIGGACKAVAASGATGSGNKACAFERRHEARDVLGRDPLPLGDERNADRALRVSFGDPE